MSNSKENAAILSMQRMRPGDSVEGEVTIQNTGDIAGDFFLEQGTLADQSGVERSGGPTVPAGDGQGAVVHFSATAADLVDGAVSVTFSPASGSVFPVGTTTVHYSATDSSGNTSSGSFPVTVLPPA